MVFGDLETTSAVGENGKNVLTMAEYIEREDLLELYRMDDPVLNENGHVPLPVIRQNIMDIPAADVGKMSDGYHTFADLYEQRLILSAALAKNNPNAWKSKRHEDGSVPFGGGWFIMGFDTDEGCYTYHYELKDWDLFQCKELDKGKPWDGHTSKDVRRLLSIPAADVAPVVRCKECKWTGGDFVCYRGVMVQHKPDDFCSYGERRGGGEDD